MDAQTSGKLIAATLLRHALGFRDCEKSTIDELLSKGRVVAFGKGEMLVRQGDVFDYLCVILEGSFESGVTQMDGRRHLLAYLQPGDIAGIFTLWDGLSHPNEMVAREAANRVMLVRSDDYRVLRDNHRSLARALELQMAYRCRLLFERVMADHSMPLEVRLARQLYLLSIISGRPHADGAQLTMRISQTDLGDFLGVSRQHVNIGLQKLKKEGLITLSYSTVTMVDPVALAQRAGLGATVAHSDGGADEGVHGPRC